MSTPSFWTTLAAIHRQCIAQCVKGEKWAQTTLTLIDQANKELEKWAKGNTPYREIAIRALQRGQSDQLEWLVAYALLNRRRNWHQQILERVNDYLKSDQPIPRKKKKA